MTLHEISTALDMPLPEVKSIYFRSLRKIRSNFPFALTLMRDLSKAIDSERRKRGSECA